jgi:hypothetical protein
MAHIQGMTPDLSQLAAWLGQLNVTRVGLEPTDIQGRPVVYALEDNRHSPVGEPAAHAKPFPQRNDVKPLLASGAWSGRVARYQGSRS